MKKLLKFIFFVCIGTITIRFIKNIIKLSTYRKVTVFGNIETPLATKELTDKSYALLFGSMNLDLRAATIAGNEMTIKIYSRFSGINIKLPQDWNISIEGREKDSGIYTKVNYDETNTTSPQLKIVYDIKFSGMKITSFDTITESTETDSN
ncbi:MAG: hypothetical protein KAS49_00310 [Candidatus Cloacimonetes bacterium]|nr:hypothetical protein [Candidatus Cloacimonadota bacterium]